MGASWYSIMGSASSSLPSNEFTEHLAERAWGHERLDTARRRPLRLTQDHNQDGPDDNTGREAYDNHSLDGVDLPGLEQPQDDGATGDMDDDHDAHKGQFDR